MADVNVIALKSDGEGRTVVDLTTALITMTTRYNYSARCWFLDLEDAEGTVLVTGLMLVPNVDILKPYPSIKELIGSLVLVELNSGDYQSVDLFGINTKLLWFAPGEEIVLS